ncbi:MAG TPA: YhbY family RNA-binding protein [Burkholderiales bacterium]
MLVLTMPLLYNAALAAMPPIELTPARRRALRASAHPLHPTVIIGETGLTAPVLAEIERSLASHELIKIKVAGADREQRESLLAEICEALSAAPVQHIGRILVIYRERPEPEPEQPAPRAAKTRRPARGTPPRRPAAGRAARKRRVS